MVQQKNNEYDVFISYARKDYFDVNKNVIPDNAITKLKNAFDKNDISYWIDEKGIYSGDRFAKLIANSIKNSKVFLFISSENSNASEWTIGEIAVAREYKKKIIPFRIDHSTYNENVIVYLAPIDYASYVENPENSVTKVVESIKEYKEYLKKKEEEEQRRAAAEKAKQQEQEKIEWELRQKEIQRKEQERLAAISEERKKKEEELKAIYDQLHNLDTEVSERKEQRIQLENEIKTIDNKLSFLDKERDQLEARRKYLEKHFAVYLQNDPVEETMSLNVNHSNTPVAVESEGADQKSKNHVLFDKKWYMALIILGFVILLFLCIKNCRTEDTMVVPEVESIVDDESLNADSTTDESIKSTIIKEVPASESILKLVPVENDVVYGITTVARIKNWNDLHVLIDGEPIRLHKVSFAFIKVMEGISEANYVQESKRNREDALNAGIRVGLYHTLNIKAEQTNATGKAQARKYYQHVKELMKNELPPVLVVPQLELGQEACAIQRCNEWIDEIKSIYNVKPIVSIGVGNYKSDFHGKLHDCIIWMDQNSVVTPTFVKMSDKKVKYYNGTHPYEEEFNNWRLSAFSGKYSEFQNFN